MFSRVPNSWILRLLDHYYRNTTKLLITKIFKKFIGFEKQAAIELDSALLNVKWNGLEIKQVKIEGPHIFELKDEQGVTIEYRAFQPVFEYIVSNSIIDTTSGVIFEDKSKGRAFYESAPFAIETISESIRPRRIGRKIQGEVAVLSNRSFHHWLMDDLPRFLLLFKRAPQIHVIAHPKSHRYVRDVLEIIKPSMVTFKSVARVENARFISAGNIESFPSMRDVNVLREFADTRNLYGSHSNQSKIFVSRRFGPSRNSHEIYFESLAKESNFQVLYFENISLREQIAIFSKASVIVASNGAVFANVVWCKPQTNIYNIYSHDWDTDSVRDLCILLDLNYRKVHYSNAKNLFKELR